MKLSMGRPSLRPIPRALMMHSCAKFYKCVLVISAMGTLRRIRPMKIRIDRERRCYEIADESLDHHSPLFCGAPNLRLAYRLMDTPPFGAAMKCKDKRRSFVWKRAIGPDLPGTGTATAFALHKNSQDRKRIYDSKSRELIEIGCSSLQACYDDESLDLMIQIGPQEGV